MADDETTDESQDESTGDTTDELGASGIQALKDERTARREAERNAKAASDRLASLEAELTELRAGQMSDQEKALEAARQEAADAARAEVESSYRSRLDAADVKAAAAKFADPADAVLFLSLDDLPRDAAGALEPKALAEALDEILTSKPHLAAGKPSQGSADGGSRGGGPAQLTRDDLKTMTPEAIVEAKANGQLATLLGH